MSSSTDRNTGVSISSGHAVGADVVVDSLVANGVDHVFGLPGTTVIDILDVISQRQDVRFLSLIHI